MPNATENGVQSIRIMNSTILVVVCLYFRLRIILVGAAFTEMPEPTENVCLSSSKTFNWKYDNPTLLNIAIWTKGTDQIGSKNGLNPGIFESEFDGKFEYISDGIIKLLNANWSDADTYKFNIIYTLASGLLAAESSTSLTVLVPPGEDLAGTCTSDSPRACKCDITDPGTPAVQVHIKIDNERKNSSSAHATSTQKVECCVVGANVECMPGKSEGDTEHCVEVPGTTPTTTTTTTITSPTTVLVTSSTNGMTTSSVSTSTASISTSTTSTMAQSTVTSTKSTVKLPSTSRGTVTRVTHVSDGDSDKAIVTMIIVVSVIGGVLVLAIFSIIFVMVHWKICFTRRGHSKQYARRSDHRKQHKQAEDNSNGRFWSTQQDQAMRGYYFYNGTYKNPLFYDSFENSSNLNNHYPNQKNSYDPKYMSSHETYQYKYDRDYNWDLKDRY